MGVIINGALPARAKLGLTEEALDLLERVFNKGWGKKDWVENDPDYDSLRARAALHRDDGEAEVREELVSGGTYGLKKGTCLFIADRRLTGYKLRSINRHVPFLNP